MTRFALTKTVTYDLYAKVETDEASSIGEFREMLLQEGEGAWNIEWEQSDGNDEVITIEMREDNNA